jgi:hypothetical protein
MSHPGMQINDSIDVTPSLANGMNVVNSVSLNQIATTNYHWSLGVTPISFPLTHWSKQPMSLQDTLNAGQTNWYIL